MSESFPISWALCKHRMAHLQHIALFSFLSGWGYLRLILFKVNGQAPNAFEGIVCCHQYATCLRFSSNMKMVCVFLIASIHIIFVAIHLYYILVYSNNDYIADLDSMILFAFRDSTLIVSEFVLADYFTIGHMHLTYFRGRKLLSG